MVWTLELLEKLSATIAKAFAEMGITGEPIGQRGRGRKITKPLPEAFHEQAPG